MPCLDCGAEYLHDDDMEFLMAHAQCDWCGDEHCVTRMVVIKDDPVLPWATLMLCNTCHQQYQPDNEGD